MASKYIFVFASVVLAQSVNSQCLKNAAPLRAPCSGIAPAYAPAYGHHGCAADIAAARSLKAAWGGGLDVASGSAVAPTGLKVASDNVYEGSLAVAGNLPFLGTIAFEGVYPTVGHGAISYGCGDGALGITAEGITSGIAPAGLAATELGYLGHGYKGYGYGIRDCGCGRDLI